MPDQFTDWTLDNIKIEDIKAKAFVPNWVRAGYTSKSEAIDGILDMMQSKEPQFAAMGLQPGQIVKRKKKSVK